MERQQNQWAKNCVTLIFSPYVKNNLMLICNPGIIRPAQGIFNAVYSTVWQGFTTFYQVLWLRD